MVTFSLKKNLFKLLVKLHKRIYFENILKWCNSNLEYPIFFISFDIETQNDVNILRSLTKKLKKIKIKPFYAVPAELIERNIDFFVEISVDCILINHGYKIHTEYNKKDSLNFSSYSYSNIDYCEIEKDIKKAHKVISALPNQNPDIYRAPHFGEFCENNSLSNIYRVLSELNYRLSSSTTPIFSLIKSPIYKVNKITEIPSSGYINNPLQIIDSWSINKEKKLTYDHLNKEMNLYSKTMNNNNYIVNVYFDPSDIINNTKLFDSISKLSNYQLLDTELLP